VFAINPGSTSTKIALLEDGRVLFGRNVSHDAEKLAQYPTIADQYPYREQTILDLLNEAHVSMDGVGAFACQGGGLFSMEGGVYEIDELVLEHARTSANGVIHPANVGPQLCHQFAQEHGAKAFLVNPPDVDELQDLARLTGIKGVYRQVHLHCAQPQGDGPGGTALSMGRYTYEDCITSWPDHIGGGISVSAHPQRQRQIDGFRHWWAATAHD
jgi:butyrate kinase